MSQDLQEKLRNAVRPLENIPDRLKDWHPGSDDKVLDLVHPSLFPIVYGLSKALPTGSVPLKECTKLCGSGEIIPTHSAKMLTKPSTGFSEWGALPAWGNYQWLPSNVHFAADGNVNISSYINNLHPTVHSDMYEVLEEFVLTAVPLWNETLSWFHDRIRIKIKSTGNDDWRLPEGLEWEKPVVYDSNASNPEHEPEDVQEWADVHGFYDEYREWKEANRILIQPEPRGFVPHTHLKGRPGARKINLRKDFRNSGLQVIFKLANIHLTPEKPDYDGGSWHIEGALNEHICATALYYYDCENVTDSYLSFRQKYDTEAMMMRHDQVRFSFHYRLPTIIHQCLV